MDARVRIEPQFVPEADPLRRIDLRLGERFDYHHHVLHSRLIARAPSDAGGQGSIDVHVDFGKGLDRPNRSPDLDGKAALVGRRRVSVARRNHRNSDAARRLEAPKLLGNDKVALELDRLRPGRLPSPQARYMQEREGIVAQGYPRLAHVDGHMHRNEEAVFHVPRHAFANPVKKVWQVLHGKRRLVDDDVQVGDHACHECRSLGHLEDVLRLLDIVWQFVRTPKRAPQLPHACLGHLVRAVDALSPRLRVEEVQVRSRFVFRNLGVAIDAEALSFGIVSGHGVSARAITPLFLIAHAATPEPGS